MILKYLYHYTSTDTLKKIISGKTIKFSRLDTMNDPLEGGACKKHATTRSVWFL